MTDVLAKSFGSLVFWYRGHFLKPSRDELIGEVLVKKKIISENDLQRAIDAQKRILFEFGKAVPLGKVVVEQGFAAESDVVRAVNEYYDISISSLSDNIKDLVRKIRARLGREIPSARIPIWLQLSIATMFVLAVSMAIFGYVIMERQKEKLYQHSIKLGMVSLNYFSNNAKIPLLNDDILELNTLINNAEDVEGHFYAFILDNHQVIKAHTDHEKIDTVFEPFQNVEKTYKKGLVSYFSYTLPGSVHVLNLSMPILFKEKKLGEVHVGLSVDFVKQLFIEERAFLAACTLLVIFLGMIVAVLFSRRFSQPISSLVEATTEISRGNYEYKVKLNRNDELGTLGNAFNRMGDELYLQSLMKESFGKYVGTEVLEMIMSNPGKGWLKGRKYEASVLFADIRGFTAYSEAKEPEEVVENLNEFFGIATEVVLKHGGYVDKFMGDSVLAVFGVPVNHKDHSERSLRAAIEMQKEFAKSLPHENSLLQSVGIGIASGVVVAGNIGSQVKTEYTVIGDCVNVASYLNNIAGAGEIIIGNGLGRQFDHLIEVEELQPQKVKGKEELVEIFKFRSVKDEAGNDKK